MKSYCCLLFFSLLLVSSAYGYTREDVVLRGSLACGISENVAGFATMNEAGEWSGFDVDICRAVAVAVLGDASKVDFVPMEAQGAYTALLSGKVDLLMLHQSDGQWGFVRDLALAVDFVTTSFYDMPGVLVKAPAEGEKSPKIDGISCILKGEELNASFFLANHGIKQKELLFPGQTEAVTAFLGGKCSMLFGVRSWLQGFSGSDTIVLPQKEERILFGPIVRHGDDNWFDIVRWAFFVMLDAESLGISSQNVEEMRTANTPQVKKFFAQSGRGKKIGLADDWAAQIVAQVGNYKEVFSRNIGEESELKLERSCNRLWRNGGLHCPPPLQ